MLNSNLGGYIEAFGTTTDTGTWGDQYIETGLSEIHLIILYWKGKYQEANATYIKKPDCFLGEFPQSSNPVPVGSKIKLTYDPNNGVNCGDGTGVLHWYALGKK